MHGCRKDNKAAAFLAIAVGVGVFVTLFCPLKFLLIVTSIVLIFVGISML